MITCFFFVSFQVKLVSASPEGNLSCELCVGEEHVNRGGTLHGGFTATLVDTISTLALIAADKPPGVSTDLSIS